MTGTILSSSSASSSSSLPVLATPPPAADIPTQIRYLLMPATAMAIVYFGYIARMTRAGHDRGAPVRLHPDRDDEGADHRPMMRRHVLRNALIPTVAVIAVQVGYLFGGIIAVEKIFNYNGMGQTMLFAAQRKDIPMLTAARSSSDRVHARDPRRRHVIAWMNPRSASRRR